MPVFFRAIFGIRICELINYTEILKMENKKPYYVLLKRDYEDFKWYEEGSNHYELSQVRRDAEYARDGYPMRVLKVNDIRNYGPVLHEAQTILDSYGKKRAPLNFELKSGGKVSRI